MNELKEASKSHLEWMKEHYEDMMKFNKDSMWMNLGLCVMSATLAILLIIISITYVMTQEWVNAILEFILAITQGWLCAFSVRRFFADKKSVNRYKAELDRIDFYLELLESEGV